MNTNKVALTVNMCFFIVLQNTTGCRRVNTDYRANVRRANASYAYSNFNASVSSAQFHLHVKSPLRSSAVALNNPHETHNNGTPRCNKEANGQAAQCAVPELQT
jgi:hypothetical protein